MLNYFNDDWIVTDSQMRDDYRSLREVADDVGISEEDAITFVAATGIFDIERDSPRIELIESGFVAATCEECSAHKGTMSRSEWIVAFGPFYELISRSARGEAKEAIQKFREDVMTARDEFLESGETDDPYTGMPTRVECYPGGFYYYDGQPFYKHGVLPPPLDI